jgi:hypothetical protein
MKTAESVLKITLILSEFGRRRREGSSLLE